MPGSDQKDIKAGDAKTSDLTATAAGSAAVASATATAAEPSTAAAPATVTVAPTLMLTSAALNECTKTNNFEFVLNFGEQTQKFLAENPPQFNKVKQSLGEIDLKTAPKALRMIKNETAKLLESGKLPKEYRESALIIMALLEIYHPAQNRFFPFELHDLEACCPMLYGLLPHVTWNLVTAIRNMEFNDVNKMLAQYPYLRLDLLLHPPYVCHPNPGTHTIFDILVDQIEANDARVKGDSLVMLKELVGRGKNRWSDSMLLPLVYFRNFSNFSFLYLLDDELSSVIVACGFLINAWDAQQPVPIVNYPAVIALISLASSRGKFFDWQEACGNPFQVVLDGKTWPHETWIKYLVKRNSLFEEALEKQDETVLKGILSRNWGEMTPEQKGVMVHCLANGTLRVNDAMQVVILKRLSVVLQGCLEISWNNWLDTLSPVEATALIRALQFVSEEKPRRELVKQVLDIILKGRADISNIYLIFKELQGDKFNFLRQAQDAKESPLWNQIVKIFKAKLVACIKFSSDGNSGFDLQSQPHAVEIIGFLNQHRESGWGDTGSINELRKAKVKGLDEVLLKVKQAAKEKVLDAKVRHGAGSVGSAGLAAYAKLPPKNPAATAAASSPSSAPGCTIS